MSTAETTRINQELEKGIHDLADQVAALPNLSYRERKHVEAVVNWSRGDLSEAAHSWEDCLLQVNTTNTNISFAMVVTESFIQ